MSIDCYAVVVCMCYGTDPEKRDKDVNRSQAIPPQLQQCPFQVAFSLSLQNLLQDTHIRVLHKFFLVSVRIVLHWVPFTTSSFFLLESLTAMLKVRFTMSTRLERSFFYIFLLL